MAVVNVNFGDKELEVISVKDENGQLWMLANPFARILDYSNARNAVTKFVKEINQIQYQDIEAPRLEALTSSLHPLSKFINRAGLFELIQGSKMPKAQEFRDWINSDLLPKLCDNGKYDMVTDAPMEISNGLNVIHVVTNDGVEAPWMKDMACLKSTIMEKDQKIDELTVTLTQSNTKLAEANDKIVFFATALVEANNSLMKSNERFENLAIRMADIAQDVIAKPTDPQLLHSLAVCSIGGDQYAFLRPQKRSLKRSLDRLSVDSNDIVFKSDYVPNAMNVLNKIKEKLPRDKFKAKHNKITLLKDLTKDDLVKAINSSLTQRQVAIIANKANRM